MRVLGTRRGLGATGYHARCDTGRPAPRAIMAGRPSPRPSSPRGAGAGVGHGAEGRSAHRARPDLWGARFPGVTGKTPPLIRHPWRLDPGIPAGATEQCRQLKPSFPQGLAESSHREVFPALPSMASGSSMLKRIDPLALRKTDPGGAQRLIAVSGGLVRRPTKGLLSNGAISGAGAEVGEEKNEVEIAARDCLLGRRSGARMA